ncbi:MAG: molecular chaperone DnaJ [Acidithiobacillales bacterium SG8_45]|jgi:DnaJ like chaperone protein|nr:MAG: molecular chaperone DnaJ [Acidithiobacillales bacterium SG8_45]
MGWWGTLVGGALGFAIGGPLGAILGAALGRNVDQNLGGRRERLGSGDQERVQAAFFTATFSVMGHLAKADGRVTRDEIALAEQVMSQMQLGADQRKAAINLFNEGKDDAFPLDAVLEQFRAECHRRISLVQMFLEIMISTALADGTLDGNEERLLYHIGDRLGFPRPWFERLVAMVKGQQHFAGDIPKSPTVDLLKDAYLVLGVSSTASDADVKKAYRRMMNQHHPDKLVAKGLPEEMMKLATEKTQEIKKAYELIKQKRGM